MAEVERSHTFLFADLAGFTALTEAMGDSDAADLAQRFYASAAELVEKHGGEQVKVIGDAIMVRTDDAATAVRLAVCLVHEVGGQHFFPSVRVGLHTGPAVQRDGDWFGAAVNLAARVSGEAGGGEVLLSDATRRSAGALDDVEFHQRGRRDLKNVAEPVLVHAAVRIGATAGGRLPLDPVCKMAVHPEHAAGRLVHRAQEFYFCSLPCAAKFASEPDRYIVSRL